MIPPEKQPEQTEPDFLLPRENPLGLRGYDQIVKLTYPDGASAVGCRISAAPLPYRKKLAFSCRWDDNNSAHLRMHGLMCRYGFRGTFYLNDLELIPPEGIAPEVFLGELLSGSCAAGCGRAAFSPPTWGRIRSGRPGSSGCPSGAFSPREG